MVVRVPLDRPFEARIRCPECGCEFTRLIEYERISMGAAPYMVRCPSCRRFVHLDRKGDVLYDWLSWNEKVVGKVVKEYRSLFWVECPRCGWKGDRFGLLHCPECGHLLRDRRKIVEER